MNDPFDLLLALKSVTEAFTHLGTRYYVGGSIASSFHGAMRSTMDVHLLCELDESHVEELLRLIGSDYYASKPAIYDAIRRQSCFNLIHLPTSFKVDVFVSQRRPFDLEVVQRAEFHSLVSSGDLVVPIATVEDVILLKLEWYRIGGEVSERQWDDIDRLIQLSRTNLDQAYLKETAELVGVRDLLDHWLSN